MKCVISKLLKFVGTNIVPTKLPMNHDCPHSKLLLYMMGLVIKVLTVHGTPLLWRPLGQLKMSWLVRCPHFRGHYENKLYVFGTLHSVVIQEVSLLRGTTVL